MQNEYWWHEPAGLAWPGFLKSFPVDVVRHYIRLVRRRWPADEWQTILFALEAEHRTVPITNETRLDCSLERIRSAGYDFSGARAIGEALDDADAVTIRVSGPTSLFSALASKMGDRSKYLRHHETADADLTVDVDGGLMETRLAEWQAAVHEVLA